ncbi:PREDICTED: uncharacterized protein LOC108568957 [Nicrophorus vespilloides]|uniref:Uncharacterized protein LOC108568957 n=1 Tax=Nicrophorus vespilloides TaxID=110193 RepID=A0ABM1NG48_NICVS|nr:PREDICTED: uncharacterized protein LOC108568957 [Nicrophorus vespilloides]
MGKSNGKIVVVFCVAALCVLINSIEARPRDISTKGELCLVAKMDETCQKCAKQTKSPLVYPMCCSDEDGVYAWCERYIHYGIQ